MPARSSIILAAVLALSPATLTAQRNLGATTREAQRAIAARDTAAGLTATDSLIKWFPDYPNAWLLRARATMIAKDQTAAEQAVRKLLGWDARYARFALTDSILKPLSANLANVDVAALAAKADSGVSRGQVWATLDERDFVPEGTAYDPATKSLLLGSLHKNRIIAISADGKVSDRVAARSNGLSSVVGIHVDAKRGILWAASNRRYDTPTDSTPAMLFAFEAASGKFIRKVPSPVGAAGFLNDITTGSDGTVYVTDTQGGTVYMLKPGSDKLEKFTGAGEVASPNGITISSDGKLLFIADLDHVQVVDLAGNKTWRLQTPDSVNVAAIDGLAFVDGALIAHHPLSFWRVARYQLDSSRTRIVGRTFIERATADSRTSTTGEVADGFYYYIGNGQIDRMNLKTIDAGTMEPIRIYRASVRD